MIGVGSALGGVFAGLVANTNQDWRWVFWMNSILTGILVLTTVLCQVETTFERPVEFEDNAALVESEIAALTVKESFHWAKALSVTGWYDRLVRQSHSSYLLVLTGSIQTNALLVAFSTPYHLTSISSGRLGSLDARCSPRLGRIATNWKFDLPSGTL